MPYRETSLIVEALTADYGRVAMVARGAQAAALGDCAGCCRRSSRSRCRGRDRVELKTLLKAEWRGGLPRVGGAALLCGFYLNELLLKLLAARGSASRPLFRDYRRRRWPRWARESAAEQATVLRRFEFASAGGAGLRAAADAATPTRAPPSILRHATITHSIAVRVRWRRT